MQIPPLSLRKTPLLEVLALLDSPGQVGHIPTMNTDASLDYPATAYQPAEIAITDREAVG